jgi:hypothetical protein
MPVRLAPCPSVRLLVHFVWLSCVDHFLRAGTYATQGASQVYTPIFAWTFVGLVKVFSVSRTRYQLIKIAISNALQVTADFHPVLKAVISSQYKSTYTRWHLIVMSSYKCSENDMITADVSLGILWSGNLVVLAGTC